MHTILCFPKGRYSCSCRCHMHEYLTSLHLLRVKRVDVQILAPALSSRPQAKCDRSRSQVESMLELASTCLLYVQLGTQSGISSLVSSLPLPHPHRLHFLLLLARVNRRDYAGSESIHLRRHR